MKVGNHEYSGKGAREEAAKALNNVVTSWRDDQTAKVRGHFKGFEILSRGSQLQEGVPELLIRGKAIYKANFNPENPVGTIQSIEHVLRGLNREADEEQREIERQEKTLADYKVQLGRPFEHESRLKELLVKQAQLNASLDLDKHDTQVVAEVRQPEEKTVPASFVARIQAEVRAAAIAP